MVSNISMPLKSLTDRIEERVLIAIYRNRRIRYVRKIVILLYIESMNHRKRKGVALNELIHRLSVFNQSGTIPAIEKAVKCLTSNGIVGSVMPVRSRPIRYFLNSTYIDICKECISKHIAREIQKDMLRGTPSGVSGCGSEMSMGEWIEEVYMTVGEGVFPSIGDIRSIWKRSHRPEPSGNGLVSISDATNLKSTSNRFNRTPPTSRYRVRYPIQGAVDVSKLRVPTRIDEGIDFRGLPDANIVDSYSGTATTTADTVATTGSDGLSEPNPAGATRVDHASERVADEGTSDGIILHGSFSAAPGERRKTRYVNRDTVGGESIVLEKSSDPISRRAIRMETRSRISASSDVQPKGTSRRVPTIRGGWRDKNARIRDRLRSGQTRTFEIGGEGDMFHTTEEFA